MVEKHHEGPNYQRVADKTLEALRADIAACTVCAASLKAGPRPIARFSRKSQIVIIGQAPGTRVHSSGIAWDDASGDRLREWTGLSAEQFYDERRVAQVPMGFCYPGKGSSGDLPPRRECAPLWHNRVLLMLPKARLTLLVGSHAQKRYLPGTNAMPMTERVRNFSDFLPEFFPLPHPSWRSTGWMRRNPWFEADVLPILRQTISARAGPSTSA